MSTAFATASVASALVLLAAQSDPEVGLRERRLARRVMAYEARAELILIGPPAVPFLLEQVTGEQQRLADESAATIRWIVSRWRGESAARAILVEQIGDFAVGAAPADRRAFAVDLLGDLGGSTAVSRLASLLAEPDLRSYALLALERIEGSEAYRTLVGALENAEPSQRETIYETLGRRGESESIPVLIAAAASGEVAAVAALSGFSDFQVLEWLTERALAGSGEARLALLANEAARNDGELLARLGSSARDEKQLEAVLAVIRSDHQYHPALEAFLLGIRRGDGALERARLRALIALGWRLEPETAASVIQGILAGVEEPTLQTAALRLCAERCPAGAAKSVARLLGSNNAAVRHAAVDALATMSDESGTAELVRAIEADPQSPDAALLILALGRRTDLASVEALLALLEAETGANRDAVLGACLAVATSVEAPEARRIWARTLAVEPTQRALSGLAATGGAEELAAIERVLLGSHGELRDAARDALVSLGRRQARAGHRQVAVPALGAAFAAGASVETDLRGLGERVDLVAHGGRVDAWWHAVERNVAPTSPAEPPVEMIEALDEAPVQTDVWRPRQAADPRRSIVLPGDDRSTTGIDWLIADLTPRQAAGVEIVLLPPQRPVMLWLNGEALEPLDAVQRDAGALQPETRALQPATGVTPQEALERRFRAYLHEGRNRLVLAVRRGDQTVRLRVALEDEAGRPLKFSIR